MNIPTIPTRGRIFPATRILPLRPGGRRPYSLVLSALCLLAVLSMLGCQNPAAGDAGPSGTSAKGSLEISFGTDETHSDEPDAASVGSAMAAASQPMASVLGPEHSRNIVDCYELIAVGTAHFFTTSIQADQNSAIPLEPDEYRIIVLAGNRRSATATTAVLVASAYSSGTVVIAAGEKSTINLVLRPVDFEWTVPAQTESGESFELYASGDSRNPYVGMLIDGSASSEHPRSKSVALWNGYHDFATVTGTQNLWTATLSVNAPTNSTAALDFQFHGTYISLLDSGAYSGSLYRRTVYTWKWLNRYDLADGDPLIPLVEKQTQIGEAQTGLTLAIVWE